MNFTAKKFTVWIALFLILALAGASAPAQEETDSQKGIPGADKYPDAPAIIVYDFIGFTVNADGSTALTEHEVIKIQNEEGKKKFENLYRAYDRKNQTLDVRSARILKPDGKIIHIDRQKEIITEAKFAGRMPQLKDYMITTIDFSKAEPGDTIEFRLILTDKKPLVDKYFWSLSFVNDEIPILNTVFDVRMHRDADRLKWLAVRLNEGKNPVIKNLPGGGKSFRWQLKDRGPVEDEPSAPSFRDRVSFIMISTCPRWEDLSDSYYKAVKNNLKPDGQVRKTVAKITANLKTGDEKLAAIGKFIQSKQIIAWQFEPERFDVSRAGQLIDQKALNRIDAVVLFVAMAEACGIEAYPVLISDQNYGKVQKELVSPYQFNQLLAMVKSGKSFRLIDPVLNTGEGLTLGSVNEGRDYLPLKPRGAKLSVSPVSPPSANREEIISDAKLMADGSIGVDLKLIEAGNKKSFWNAFLKLMRASEKEKGVFAKLVTLIAPEAKLLSFNIDTESRKDAIIIDLIFIADNYPQVSGDYWVLKLPVAPAKNPDYLEENIGDRKLPIVISTSNQDIKKVGIKIPEGFQVVSVPSKTEIKNSTGSLSVDCTYDKDQISYSYQLDVYRNEIPPERFKELVELYQNAYKATGEVIILKKN